MLEAESPAIAPGFVHFEDQVTLDFGHGAADVTRFIRTASPRFFPAESRV